MRSLVLVLLALALSPAVAAQEASLALLASEGLTPGDEVSVEALAAIGVESDVPGVVVALPHTPIGYSLPADLRPSEKDEGIAYIIGILLPGGGQIYAGDTSKGLRILALGYGSLLVGSIILPILTDSAAVSLLGFAGYVGAVVYGILQVPEDVEAANRRNGYALAPTLTQTPDGPRGALALRVRL